MTAPMFLQSALFAAHGLQGLFTTRNGGCSEGCFASLNLGLGLGDAEANVSTNLERLMRKAGLQSPPHQAVQVHGTGMLRCQGRGNMHDEAADALWTRDADTPVAVRTADCLPLLLADPVAGIVAAVHAGWRGTAAGIAQGCVDQLKRQGAAPERMLASLGPCIGPCCFAVDAATARALAQSTDDAEACVRSMPEPSESAFRADLVGLNRLQLLHAGLQPPHIETLNACTSCNESLFYSHRRDQGQCGRMLAVVVRPASP